MMHEFLRQTYRIQARNFSMALSNPEEVQRKILKNLLQLAGNTKFGQRRKISGDESYETFQGQNPVSTYRDWQPEITAQRQSGTPQFNQKVVRYEPTSGSSGERKWIPYTPHFLSELNQASAPWIYQIYRQYPGTRRGRHFWSMSWIPQELRGQLDTDDSKLFPWWQRWLMQKMLLTHPQIRFASDSETAWQITKLALASCQDLSLLSVWSPTYLTSIIQELFHDRQSLARQLRISPWLRTDFPADAQTVQEFAERLWPKLSLISAWDSASSEYFAQELRKIFVKVPFQGKGLWATEGVVTIPWQGQHPLAICSHFYEFKCLQTGKVLPSWKLALDQEIQPILTTGSGLLRYALPDRLRVKSFIEKTPSLQLLGRLQSSDLVGEKIGFAYAQEILQSLRAEFSQCTIYGLGTCRDNNQGIYFALATGDKICEADLAIRLEQQLLKAHHYASARELQQLQSARALILASDTQMQPLLNPRKIRGQNKLDPITDFKENLFAALG